MFIYFISLWFSKLHKFRILLKFRIDKIKLGSSTILPIRFYDCPGIDGDEDERMDLQVLESVIDGHIRGDAKVILENANDDS